MRLFLTDVIFFKTSEADGLWKKVTATKLPSESAPSSDSNRQQIIYHIHRWGITLWSPAQDCGGPSFAVKIARTHRGMHSTTSLKVCCGASVFVNHIPEMLNWIESWGIWRPSEHFKLVVVLVKPFLNLVCGKACYPPETGHSHQFLQKGEHGLQDPTLPSRTLPKALHYLCWFNFVL